MFDFLIVGAGFAGSVLAERLVRVHGRRVIVVDRRPHIGGNAYDEFNDAGILVHRYGPHIFHCNSAEIFAYLSQFTDWRPYQHRVRAEVDGQLVPLPINLDTINQLYGMSLTSFQAEAWLASVAEPDRPLRTAEDAVVRKIGRDLFNKFFRGYTRKQWGVDACELDAHVTARIPTRVNRDDRYFSDAYQAMPLHGYTRMFQRMLDHPNIKLLLNADYREVRDAIPHRQVIYTGPIDEFFDHCFGALPYRSLAFRFETHTVERVQSVGTINFPNAYDYTRVTEFKHLTGQVHPHTTVVYEYPTAHGDPFYPVPRPANAALYKRYEELARQTPGVHFAGRLGTYQYYNMDQVVAQALTLARRLGCVREDLNGLGPISITVDRAVTPEVEPVTAG